MSGDELIVNLAAGQRTKHELDSIGDTHDSFCAGGILALPRKERVISLIEVASER